MKTALATTRLHEVYQQTVLDDVLGEGWETTLREVGRCVVVCDHYGSWGRLAQTAREYRPNFLARLRGFVVDWLNE